MALFFSQALDVGTSIESRIELARKLAADAATKTGRNDYTEFFDSVSEGVNNVTSIIAHKRQVTRPQERALLNWSRAVNRALKELGHPVDENLDVDY